MARHILIIEKHAVQRRDLQAKIMSILDDVIISEVGSAEQALQIFERSTVHLVLYGLDKGDSSAIDFVGTARGKNMASFLLLIYDSSIDVEPYDSLGVDCLQMPCSAKKLGGAVDNICNPVCLRKDKRYSLPGATGIIEQGRQRYDGTVLNVSEGGVLCDFEVDRLYNSSEPVMIAISLPIAGKIFSVEKLYSVTSSMKVLDRNSDFSPCKIRLGFKFVIVPAKAKEVLRQLAVEVG